MNNNYLSRSVILKILGLLTFAIGLDWLLQRYEVIPAFLIGLLSLLAPLLMGTAIAFLLNLPLRLIEHLLFRKPFAQSEPVFLDRYEKIEPINIDMTVENQKKKPQAKLKHQIINNINKYKRAINRSLFIRIHDASIRPVSLFLSLLLVLGLIVAVMVIVVPELVNSIQSLIKNFPAFLASTQKWIQDRISEYPELKRFASSFEFNVPQIEAAVVKWLEFGAGSMLETTFKFATAVFGGAFNIILSMVVAIYILFHKETLNRQAKLLLKAFVPDRKAIAIIRISTLTNQSFNNFIVGQFIEAVILGMLFLVVMSIFNFPYIVLISVVIGFTALVPMIGSFVGGAISALLVLMASPKQFIWFLILFIVLQQIENNLIYPRVVGKSIGLPGMWVLIAVIIGGKLFGVIGIILFIPVFSIIYVLIREYTYKRIKNKAANVKPDAS